MARKRKMMSLYEVIRTAQVRSGAGKAPEQPPSQEPGKDKSGTVPAAGWPRRPRIVQFNAGRVEFSMPYQIAIVILLGMILVVLLVYRLGQISERRAGAAAKTLRSVQEDAGLTTVDTMQPVEKISPDELMAVEKAVPVKSKGNNKIVITEYARRTDLVPVQNHFAQAGIETEIATIDNTYFLRTVDKYENPGRPGTDGYYARQKIIEWGAEYKAPQGLETFGPRPFHDAYGRRFDD